MASYSHNANCLTPVMTSNTTPSPVVISASSYFSTDVPCGAFDQSNVYPHAWTADSTTGWLQVYSGGDKWLVTSYTLSSASDGAILNAMPKNWTLQGSADGNSWTTVSTVTNSTSWSSNEMRTFTVASPGVYLYYKLDITANNGYSRLRLYELELIGSIIVPIVVDISESSSASDETDSWVAITSDVSESSSSSDIVDGTKDQEIIDVIEVSGSIDNVEVYQDYSICDISEVSETTDSVNATAGADIDISESSESTDYVEVFNTFFGDSFESSICTDTVDILNKTIFDRTGSVSLIAEPADFVALGVVGNTGKVLVYAKEAAFSASGAVGNTGVFVILGGAPTFSSSGIVGNFGELLVVADSGSWVATGVSGTVGNISCEAQPGAFASAGSTIIIGILFAAGREGSFLCEGVTGTTGGLRAAASAGLFSAFTLSGSSITYCLNLFKKGLVSTFTNFEFSSFATINGEELGAKVSGLYLLSGGNEVVSSSITWPFGKFGTTKEKQLRAVKAFGRSEGVLLLTITDGTDKSWQIELDLTTGMIPTETINYFSYLTRGRYLQASLVNSAGCDFLLDQLELVFYILGRA